MIGFSGTTAFRLVRRLAMEQGGTAIYLLIHGDEARTAVEIDLQAEIEVQLGHRLVIREVSELFGEDDAMTRSDSIRVIRIDSWSQDIVSLLDTHVIRLERQKAQFLFLTTEALSERLLVSAPNFRNRLTDVLRILPEDSSGGAPN
jgi:hypothetical protein